VRELRWITFGWNESRGCSAEGRRGGSSGVEGLLKMLPSIQPSLYWIRVGVSLLGYGAIESMVVVSMKRS